MIYKTNLIHKKVFRLHVCVMVIQVARLQYQVMLTLDCSLGVVEFMSILCYFGTDHFLGSFIPGTIFFFFLNITDFLLRGNL